MNPAHATSRPQKLVLRLDRAAKLLVFVLPILLCLRTIGVGVDDQSYLLGFADAPVTLNYGFESPLVLFFNEPLFLGYGALLSGVPEFALRLTIFLGALLAGLGVGRLSNWSLACVAMYFIFPPSLLNHVDHLRQGLAVGIYFFALSFHGKVRWFRLLAPLLHSSFWIILAMEYACNVLLKKNRETSTASQVTMFVCGAFVSIAFAIIVFFVATALGFRQVEHYNFNEVAASGLGLIYWIAMTPIIILAGRTWLHAFFCMVVGFYIGGYFANPVAARIFESSFPLMFSNKYRRTWAFVLLFSILTFSLFYWVTSDKFLRLFP